MQLHPDSISLENREEKERGRKEKKRNEKEGKSTDSKIKTNCASVREFFVQPKKERK